MDPRFPPAPGIPDPFAGVRHDHADMHGVLSTVLRDTRKALKNRHLYAHVDGHGAEQFAAAHARFSQLLETVGEIVLRVEVSTFLWLDQRILEDDSRDINMIFPLFHAGVRRVTFRRGMSERDFVSFWTTVGAELTYEGSEDLLTRLWKFGFDHISWLAHADLHAIDDSGAFTMQVLALGVQEMRSRPSADQQMRAARDRMAHHYTTQQRRCTDAGLPMLTEPALAVPALEREMANERQRVLVSVGRALLEIALIESKPETADYLADGFEQTAVALLDEGKLVQVCVLADQAAELSARQLGNFQRQALATAINGLTRAMRRPESITKIAALCADGSSVPPAAFESLSRLLVSSGCGPALELLEQPISATVRTVLLKAMTHWGLADAMTIARKARGAEERVAIALIDVLVAMPIQTRTTMIEPTLQHPAINVRRRAIRAIVEANEGPAAIALLVRHLERSSEAAERYEVLNSLSVLESPESERALVKFLEQAIPDSDDCVAAWRAILTLRSNSSLEVAMAVTRMNTRGFLGPKDEEMKVSLVEAAGALGGQRASRVLTTIIRAPDASSKQLIKRAQDLMTTLEAAGRGSRS